MQHHTGFGLKPKYYKSYLFGLGEGITYQRVDVFWACGPYAPKEWWARESYTAFTAKVDAFTTAFDALRAASKILASTNKDDSSTLSALQASKAVLRLSSYAFKASTHAFYASV
jgi:hypothetical protein